MRSSQLAAGLVLLAGFVPLASGLEAGLGAEFLYGEYSVQGRDGFVGLDPLGPGLSLSLAGESGWSAALGYSRQTDRKGVRGEAELDYEIESLSAQAGYGGFSGDRSYWLTLFWQRDEETLELEAPPGAPPALDPLFQEDTLSHSLGLELGHGWHWEQLSGSLAFALTGLRSDTERESVSLPRERLLVTTEGEDTLEGLDAGLTGSLDYFQPLSATAALVPALRLSYQRSLSGEITGSTRSGLISRRGRRALSVEDSAQTVEGDNQLSLDLALDLLAGPWQAYLNFNQPLLEEPRDALWVLGVTYRFDPTF